MTTGRRVSARPVPRRRLLVATAAAAILVVPILIWLDQQSVERGNRLYRGGDPPAAVEAYRGPLSRGSPPPATEFNLGTALLPVDPDSAEGYLLRATGGSNQAARQRGFYNLGYRYLTAVQGPMEPDSSVAILAEAVLNNRAALRLDPTDGSARWNLSLAQRQLDALVPPDQAEDRDGSSNDAEELAMDDQSLTRSESAEAESGLEPEDPRQADNIGERQGAEDGAREAWASQDPGPMTRGAAVGLLRRTVNDEAESLIRGILWSHRPDIAWWESQPYPGGGW